MRNKTIFLKASAGAALLLILTLELLPWGAVLNFMGDPATGETFRTTYSYFSLTPFWLANFGPLLTAVLTCTLLLTFVIYLFTKKRTPFALIVLSAAAFLTSLMPLLYGIRFYSLTGAAISLLLALLTVIAAVLRRANE